MNWNLLVELIKIETNSLSSFDQTMYGLAIMAPFVGLFSAWFLAVSTRGLFRGIMVLLLPVVWSLGIGYILFTVPAQGIRLLILSYGISIGLTGVHLGVAGIIISAQLFDFLKNRLSDLTAYIFKSNQSSSVVRSYPVVVE